MAINLNDVIDRLANVEKRCKVSVEVCLAKLETFNHVTKKVSQLNERLANHEIVLARMESGLKQMEELEDRLIDTIRADKEDFEIRLGVLEEHWTTMDQRHTYITGGKLNITKRSGRCRHRTTRV